MSKFFTHPLQSRLLLALAEVAGNQPRQPEVQVPVQQIVNAPNDGGGHANAPPLEVSCFISFGCVFKFPHLAGFRFYLGGGKMVLLCLRGCKLLVLFTPVWWQLSLYFYACVALNCEFYLGLCGDKFMPV